MDTNKLTTQVRDLFYGKALVHLVQAKFIQDCKTDIKSQWLLFIAEKSSPITDKLRLENHLDEYMEKATKYMQETRNNYERVLKIYNNEPADIREDLITLIDSFIFRRDCKQMVKYNLEYWKDILPSYFDVYMSNSMSRTATIFKVQTDEVKKQIKGKIMGELLEDY